MGLSSKLEDRLIRKALSFSVYGQYMACFAFDLGTICGKAEGVSW